MTRKKKRKPGKKRQKNPEIRKTQGKTKGKQAKTDETKQK